MGGGGQRAKGWSGVKSEPPDYLLNFLFLVMAPISLMPKAFREVWKFFQTRNHLRVCKSLCTSPLPDSLGHTALGHGHC